MNDTMPATASKIVGQEHWTRKGDDEEVGSEVSRPHTERLARESKAVLVLEPEVEKVFRSHDSLDLSYRRAPTSFPAAWLEM